MIDWLSSKGFLVHLHGDRTVTIQRGPYACHYSSVLAAFMAQDGPYTRPDIEAQLKRKK